MEKEALFRQLSTLAGRPANFGFAHQARLPPETLQWLGRVEALIEEANLRAILVDLRVAMQMMKFESPITVGPTIMQCLYRALANLELGLPAAAQATFIPAGNEFQLMATLANVLSEAKLSVLLIDPYMDEVGLTDFAVLAAEGVTICLLADAQSAKPTFQPAVERWKRQYQTSRPLEARLAPARTLHDRAIMIDGADVWIVSQSFKDFAKRSHGTISRLEADAGRMKIEAYQQLWNTATIV